MAELSAGVRALVGRMESNPNEFYGEADKWRFMFSANFRDVLTEPEKGALHEGLKEVRRKEFDEKVMRELLKDDMESQLRDAATISNYPLGLKGGFGQAQIKAEGTTVRLNNPTTSLQLGKQTLSEQDLEHMKAVSVSTSFFK